MHVRDREEEEEEGKEELELGDEESAALHSPCTSQCCSIEGLE